MDGEVDLDDIAAGTVVWDHADCAPMESPAEVVNDLLSYTTPEVGDALAMRSREFLGRGVMTLDCDADGGITHRLDVPVPEGCDFVEDAENSPDSDDLLAGEVPATVAAVIETIDIEPGDTSIEVPLRFWRMGPTVAFALTLTPCAVPAEDEDDAHVATASGESVDA